MSNAPEVRGLFLKALGRPVIVAPSSAEPTVTFDGPLTEVCPCSLKETELPVVVRAGSVLEQDASAFRLSTDINYVAFFLVTKHLGQLLARQHSTAPEWLTDIIQINSKSGLVGSNKNAAYAGSKFGGIGLVQSFALEMVAHGVKLNAICPGNFYDGPLWSDPDRGLFVQYLNSGKVPGAKTVADVKEFYEAKVPMRRGAQGIDVLRAIFYIVEQEYETGQAVPVTGGQVMLS